MCWMANSLRVSVALVSSALVAAQQNVCVRGLVERPPPFSFCVSQYTHEFRCANLKLVSNAINLTSFEGQVVEVCGPVTNSTVCRIMTVQSLVTPVDHLLISGPVGGRIGRGQPAQFDLGITPALFWIMLFSDRFGFIDTGGAGVFLLDPRFFPFADGFLDATGSARVASLVPSDPTLVGARLYFQPVFVDLATLRPATGNADCFEIF